MRQFFNQSCFSLLLAAVLAFASPMSSAQNVAQASVQGKTEILWLGQAGFRITTPKGKIILIDPWITGGPRGAGYAASC